MPQPMEQIVKSTFRLPKPLVKRIKQYGLDSEKSLNIISIEAFDEYLKKRNH